jgi:hypothetical protein
MSCKPFCFLEKDQKTYSHVCEYYDAVQNNIPFMAIDNIIQKRELQYHLEKYCKSESKEESQNWIEKNAVPFRSYINSLKLFSLFLLMDGKRNFRDNVPYELFEIYADIWNQEKKILIDTIQIKE